MQKHQCRRRIEEIHYHGGTKLNLGTRCKPPFDLRKETDPVSETSSSLEYRRMDKVQKPSNPECYPPSSEPSRIDNNLLFCKAGQKYEDM
jgi:hypothetical protein